MMVITRKKLRSMSIEELKSLYAFYKNKKGFFSKLILKSVFNEIIDRELKNGIAKTERFKELKKSIGIDI